MEKFIYNFFNKTKGTISVFLVIILVPLMAMCSLFVDASRIIMAQSVVASSSDLALNTVMADFDKQLAEIYGLMASCQNKEQSVKVAKQYFKDCLVSKGIDTLQADVYADKLSQMLNNKATVNDLLGISVDDSSLSITQAPNGSLKNTAIFKEQIVEFMKYRGPIEGLTDLMDKFKSIKKTAENAEKEAKMVKEMEDYYKTENSLLEELEKAYDEIQEYNKLNITSKYISDLNTYTNTVESKYKDIHIKVFKDLFNTGGVSKFSYGTVSTTVVSKKYSTKKIPTKKNATDLIKNSAASIYNFKNANSNLKSALNGLNTYSGSYDLQYWVQSAKTLNSKNYLTNYYNKANSVVSQRANLKNLIEFLPEEIKSQKYNLYYYEGVNTSGEKTIGEHLQKLYDQANGLITSNIGNKSNDYYTICNRLKSISDKKYSAISRTATNESIKSISDKLRGYYGRMDDAKKKAASIAKHFDNAEKLVDQLHRDYEEWKTAANDPKLHDTDLVKENRQILKDVDEETMKNVTKEKVSEIKNRFNSISSLFGNVQKYIDGLKYGSKKKAVKDLRNVDDVIGASGIVASQVVVNKTTLEKNAANSFKFSKASVSTSVTNKNNPDLSVNTPALYNYMKKKFTAKNDSDMTKSEAKRKKKDQETEKEKNGDSSKVNTDGSNLSTNEIKGQSGLPSSSKGGNKADAKVTDQISNVASYVGGFFNNFGNQIEQSRDTYYELLYIMNMFSYDTYEKEGKYKLVNEGRIGGIARESLSAKYSAVDGKWKSEDKKFTNNKTLTNHMINSKNNFSYGNEVEYILYGEKNKSNKNSAYGTIFAFRYVFNMTYGFTKIYTDKKLDGLAAAVSAATQGVIPAPLFKIIVVLGLVTAESVEDINCLKEGMPVPLFKDDNSFKNKFSGKKGNNKNISNAALAFFYSDYIKLFLFVKLLSNENAILLRTLDVIQMNMQQKVSGFSISNCTVYYQLKATCTTPTLLLSLDMIKPQVTGVDFKKSKWNQVVVTSYRGY